MSIFYKTTLLTSAPSTFGRGPLVTTGGGGGFGFVSAGDCSLALLTLFLEPPYEAVRQLFNSLNDSTTAFYNHEEEEVKVSSPKDE